MNIFYQYKIYNDYSFSEYIFELNEIYNDYSFN